MSSSSSPLTSHTSHTPPSSARHLVFEFCPLFSTVAVPQTMDATDTTAAKGCRIIIVEGNISAGKSTLCRELATSLGFELFLEPVVTNPYLELYYGDAAKYGLAMQLWLLRQRFVMYARALQALLHPAMGTKAAKGVVLDRSLMSDIVFADKNLADGNISPEGYAEYSRLREHLLSLVPLPDAVVFLDATAEVCYARIHGLRKRGCESGIPLAYLAGLDECYQSFNKDMAAKGCHVLTFDWKEFGKSSTVAAAVKALPAPAHAAAPLDSSATNAPTPAAAAAAANNLLSSRALFERVQNDTAVLAALTCLPPHCAAGEALLASLAPPDMADARETCLQEAALSESEGHQQQQPQQENRQQQQRSFESLKEVIEPPKSDAKAKDLSRASPKSVLEAVVDLTISPTKGH